jgi:hypothetical protein
MTNGWAGVKARTVIRLAGVTAPRLSSRPSRTAYARSLLPHCRARPPLTRAQTSTWSARKVSDFASPIGRDSQRGLKKACQGFELASDSIIGRKTRPGQPTHRRW